MWRPEAVTPKWLTDVLRRAGVLHHESVESCSFEAVGTGQMGDSFRFQLAYGTAGTGAPATVVGKFTAADEQSRATGVSMRTAEVEVRFYQLLAPLLSARLPACYFADVDPATAQFVLLLEDLAPACQGDQLAGCSVDEAAAAIDELAQVHAPYWGDPFLETLEWLNRRDQAGLDALIAIFPLLWQGFVERYDDRLSADVRKVGDDLFPRISRYMTAEPGPRTIQHADYRVDNLLFGAAGGRVAVVDWQTVTLGPGGSDVSYFLGGSIDVEDRRAHERDLLRRYHERIVAGGVDSYGLDDLWQDYRRHAYAGLIMAVGAAMMVARTPRGDDMFMAMASRAATHALDMESAELL